MGRVLRARTRLHPAHALLGRGHLHRVLGAHVQGDDGRRGQDQVPDQRAPEGKRNSQIEEYLDFHGGPGVQHVDGGLSQARLQ